MAKSNAKAHTADQLAKHLATGELDCVKTCSRCNRVYVFYADRASCPACSEGNLYPISRYLKTEDNNE